MKHYKVFSNTNDPDDEIEKTLNNLAKDGYKLVAIMPGNPLYSDQEHFTHDNYGRFIMEKEIVETEPQFNHEHGLLTNVQRLQMEEMTNAD